MNVPCIWLQASSQHWHCRCPGRQRRPSKCRMPHVGVAQRSQQGGLLHTGQAGGQPDLLSQLGSERLGNTSCRVSGGCTKARRGLLSDQGVHTVAPRATHSPCAPIPSQPHPAPLAHLLQRCQDRVRKRESLVHCRCRVGPSIGAQEQLGCHRGLPPASQVHLHACMQRGACYYKDAGCCWGHVKAPQGEL